MKGNFLKEEARMAGVATGAAGVYVSYYVRNEMNEGDVRVDLLRCVRTCICFPWQKKRRAERRGPRESGLSSRIPPWHSG